MDSMFAILPSEIIIILDNLKHNDILPLLSTNKKNIQYVGDVYLHITVSTQERNI